MKRFLGVIVVFAVLFCSCTGAFARIVDRIVAIVNEDIVTLTELDEFLRPYEDAMTARNYSPDQKREALFRLRQDAISQLIEKKLTDQEVRKLGITVGKEEIDHSIEQIKESNFFTEEELRAALKAEGMTLEKLREDTRGRLLRARLVNIQVKSRIVVTDEDIQRYYEAHPEKYGGSTWYELRHIVVAPGDAGVEAARERMEGIVAEIRNGAGFEDMARTESDSPLRDQGGFLGRFGLKDLAPSIADAIRDLSPGEVSGVVETPQGLQLFYLEARETEGGKPVDAVSGEIREILYNEIIEEKFTAWISEMKENAYIKIIY